MTDSTVSPQLMFPKITGLLLWDRASLSLSILQYWVWTKDESGRSGLCRVHNMARTKLGERLAFLARAGQTAAGPQPQPGEKAPSAAAAPHCAVPPAPEPLAPSAAQPLTSPAAPATAPLALSAAQPLASPAAPARAPSSSVTSVGEERGRKRAKPVQRYKVGLGFRRVAPCTLLSHPPPPLPWPACSG